jgi:hypothetical protein
MIEVPSLIGVLLRRLRGVVVARVLDVRPCIRVVAIPAAVQLPCNTLCWVRPVCGRNHLGLILLSALDATQALACVA